MAIPLLTRLRVLAAKVETTVGTAVSLANTDAGFKVEDRMLRIVRESGRRQKQGSGGSDVAVAEAAHTELTFTGRVHGKGGVGVPAWADAFLQAAGFVKSGQAYGRSWATGSWKSISAGHYLNGVAKLGRGMMGNLVFNFTPGGMCTYNGTYQGGYVADPTDTAVLTGMTYESVTPPIWVPGTGNALTIDGETIFKPSQMTIDLQNEVSLVPDPNADGGFSHGYITAGVTRWTLDPLMLLRADFDWAAKQSSNDTFTITAVLDGGTNNTITFTDTVQVVEAPEEGDREGKAIESVVLESVDDSTQITFS